MMVHSRLKSGYSLTELIVVVSIIAMVAGLGLPAANQVIKSFESSSRTRDVIAAAFSNARALAIKNTKYTGIRFQQNKEGNQYMVFIQLDNAGTGLANGFSSVMGRSPIRLPKSGIVLDLHLRTNVSNAADSAYDQIDTDVEIDSDVEIYDAAVFCVIFSPAGKLVSHEVRIKNSSSNDNIFNENLQWKGVPIPRGHVEPLLYIDSYPGQGLGQEVSRNNFIIVDKPEFNSVPSASRWTSYLQYKKPIYINPYSGELID